MASDFELKSLRSFDGTQIAYQLMPGGDGLPIVLANGLGGDYRAWKHIVAHFAGRHPVVTWDYRGLYGSSLPPGNDPDLSIRAHVGDLLSMLDASGVTGTIGAGSGPSDMDVSRDSRFLYARAGGVNQIAIFSIGADGSLASLGGWITSLPAGWNGLAAR